MSFEIYLAKTKITESKRKIRQAEEELEKGGGAADATFKEITPLIQRLKISWDEAIILIHRALKKKYKANQI